jgi:hypothetical protein
MRAFPKIARYLVIGAIALPWCGAARATDVSGPIIANTTWVAVQSPYRVTADIVVQNSATLTIEPGVTVRMQPGTNLLVSAGSLQARGTAVLPIVVTSTADDGSGTPVAGGWGVVRFLDGTNDAGTILEYVQIRYGQGMVIESASPTLNFLTFLADPRSASILTRRRSASGCKRAAMA